MAAARSWRFVLRGPGLSLHTAAEAAVTAPAVTGSDVKAAPVARYPPIMASLTADSKGSTTAASGAMARHGACTANSVDEKLRILTKMQFMKYVVYPQTFALNADRWYRNFTKTVFLSGLPPFCQQIGSPRRFWTSLLCAPPPVTASCRSTSFCGVESVRPSCKGNATRRLTLLGPTGSFPHRLAQRLQSRPGCRRLGEPRDAFSGRGGGG